MLYLEGYLNTLMLKRVKFLLTLSALVLAVALLTTGCSSFWQQKTVENVTEQALEEVSNEDIDVSTTDESTTITTEDGSTTSYGEVELPANFPADIPVYPNAKITFTHKSGDSQENATLSLESDGEIGEIDKWYTDEIANQGWTLDTNTSINEDDDTYYAYLASKGDRQLTISITPQDDKIIITAAAYSAE